MDPRSSASSTQLARSTNPGVRPKRVAGAALELACSLGHERSDEAALELAAYSTNEVTRPTSSEVDATMRVYSPRASLYTMSSSWYARSSYPTLILRAEVSPTASSSVRAKPTSRFQWRTMLDSVD
uniref:Uncharacterized protein n=1 Tax=Florenciella parvula TaxID=236787 RepID=A0A7S2G8U0_9STRA